jgi:hypothetical protein
VKQTDSNLKIRISRPTLRLDPLQLSRWLPTPGNVFFTLLVIGGLFWAQSAGAITLSAPTASSTSTGTIAYQGRLADTAGAPLTGTYNMIFRLYAVASGGTPLWEEQWTNANSVQVSDGLFNVMLGSLTAIPEGVITGNSNLFLGITVGGDSEMTPRVQVGSVPFAIQARNLAVAYKARVRSSGMTDIPTHTWTELTLDVELYDPNNNFAANSYTVPENGTYLIVAKALFASVVPDKEYGIRIRTAGEVSNSSIQSSGLTGNSYLTAQTWDMLKLTAGEVVKVDVIQYTGANTVDIAAGQQYTYFAIHKISDF